MPGFLVNSKDDCNCCPEMRCCTPETVVATVSGIPEGGVVSWFPGGVPGIPQFNQFDEFIGYLRQFNQTCPAFEFVDGVWKVGPHIETHGCYDGMLVEMGRPETLDCQTLTDLGACVDFGGQWIYASPDGYTPWNPAAFPPVQVSAGLQPLSTCGSRDVTYTDNTALCDPQGSPPGDSLFCTRPTGSLYWGQVTGTTGVFGRFVQESDLNTTYVCRRPDYYVRPQLKATITRQVPLSPARVSQYPGVTEAHLIYNVAESREWVFLGPPWDCHDILFPNDGDKFIVDYRCGKRNPWYAWEGGEICFRGKCTGLNQGIVKPHLFPYHQALNHSASLYLRLGPQSYEADLNGRFPADWQVIGVDIHDGGGGYAVGEFFYVNYDNAIGPLGGERIQYFTGFDMSCVPPYFPTWVDKYGYSGQQVLGGWLLYQRIRISEVTSEGAIVALEVVPIFKNPEFKDPPFCNVVKLGAEKTKFYTGYGRVLCHPRSVQFPGIGYTVGDTIEWHCDDPACDEIEVAHAIVSDVDAEGGILDWRIRGSDFPGAYATVQVCDETDANGNCLAFCFQRPVNPPAAEDDRGHYEWKAKVLCELRWEAVGGPTRAQQGCGNQSNFTNLQLMITRRACETSIEAVLSTWPFGATIERSSDLGVTRALYLFPPYPNCAGGGAVVRPIFGAWGANESDFGSSLTGAVVEAGGAGYCYREKRHVQPTLPLDVPTLGGGTGARIASFQFSAKHNFPNPATPYGEHTPEFDRFSYFPVIGATVDQAQRGTGYTVGQEFSVSPVGGREVNDMWKASGGDNPEQCPNGAWYDGERSLLNNDGYRSLLYNPVNGTWGEAVHQEPSICRLRVSAVTESGGIAELEVVHGGMMFRTEYTVGKKNPLVSVVINSTLGYGAYIASTFDTTWGSATFGELTSVSVVAPPEGTMDPKHPGVSPRCDGSQEPPGLMPTGGRDYADQSAGYFWMLENVYVGGGVVTSEQQWFLQGHLGWHGHGPGEQTPEPTVPRNYSHEAFSTHNVLSGSMPPFVPRSSVCAFEECYHSLLNRTYPLVKVWGNGSVNSYAPPLALSHQSAFEGAITNPPNHALLIPKCKVPYTDAEDLVGPVECDEFGDCVQPVLFPVPPNAARDWEYVVVQHGPTLTLNAPIPGNCPDHTNGTPRRR